MPCDSGMGNANAYDFQARTELDRTTRILCGVLAALEANGIAMNNLDPETDAWWQHHKEIDARRVAAEKAATERLRVAREAYDHMTPEQRMALGLMRRP